MSEEGLANMMKSLVNDKERIDALEKNMLKLARSVEVIQDQMDRVLTVLEKIVEHDPATN